MIGTAFSLIIRLELMSPGVQFLAGDHQLFNVIISAHAFLMSTLSNSVDTCDIDIQGSCLCVVGIIIYFVNHTAFLPGLTKPNKIVCAVVGYRGNLPINLNSHKVVDSWKAVLYGDVKKLVTQVVDQKEPRVLSESVCPSLAELNSQSRTKNTVGIINDCIVLPAKTNPNEGVIAQAPNQDNLGETLYNNINLNQANRGIQDLTASTLNNLQLNTDMRERSQHSTVTLDGKAGSVKNSNLKGEILDKNIYKVVLKELNNYKDSEGKYNGIIRIIDSKMLQTCYSLIKSNPGNMTTGNSNIKLEDINLEWFDKTAKNIKEGRFNFYPARQTVTTNFKNPEQFRITFLANTRDKIVQKAIQVLLNAIFEPLFSKSSYGFRPGLSVVNVLDKIHMRGGHMAWAIVGNIHKCFDNISHEIIMNSLKEKITCVRTLTLIERSLKAGYINDKGAKIKCKVGNLQGSILAPLLINIVLDKLDKYMESLEDTLNMGIKRKLNKVYARLEGQRKYYKTRNPLLATAKLKEMRKISKLDMHDDNYRRAIYIRYADDFLILLASKKEFALDLKAKILIFLKENCGLELNDQKVTITNTRKGLIFLGAQIVRRDNKSIFNSFKGRAGNKITRRSTLRMAVDAPIKLLIEKLIENKFARRNHIGTVLAKGKTDIVHLTHYDIVRFFNSKITGLLTAYKFAGNFSIMARVIWILRQSCALTLARKLKLKTMKKVFTKFGLDLQDPLTKVILNIPKSFSATFDYRSVKHEAFGNLEDIVDKILRISWAGKLTKGLALKCQLCGTLEKVEMHHLRNVSDIRNKIRTGKITWAQWNGAVERKQIPLCKNHHNLIHKGLLNHTDMLKILKYREEGKS